MVWNLQGCLIVVENERLYKLLQPDSQKKVGPTSSFLDLQARLFFSFTHSLWISNIHIYNEFINKWKSK